MGSCDNVVVLVVVGMNLHESRQGIVRVWWRCLKVNQAIQGDRGMKENTIPTNRVLLCRNGSRSCSTIIIIHEMTKGLDRPHCGNQQGSSDRGTTGRGLQGFFQFGSFGRHHNPRHDVCQDGNDIRQCGCRNRRRHSCCSSRCSSRSSGKTPLL